MAGTRPLCLARSRRGSSSFYYVSRTEPKDGPDHIDWEMRCAELRTRLDVICGKQRQGAVGTDRQVYEAEYDHIEDWRE